MKNGFFLLSFLYFASLNLTGCASTKNYMNDVFSVEKRSCSRGNGESCSLLGTLYYYGSNSTPQSYSESFKYYKTACDNNFAQACNKVGLMIESGEGVNKNYTQASAYYAKGCKLKNALACSNHERLK